MTGFTRLLLAAASILLAGVVQAGAQQQEALPVPTVTIYPGDTISEAMLIERYYPPGTTARFPVVSAPQSVIGKVARRTLLPGKAIPLNAVADAEVVVRGATVQAVFELGGLSMATLVTALQSGSVGATVQARNLDSGRVIAGLVQPDGTLRIGAQ